MGEASKDGYPKDFLEVSDSSDSDPVDLSLGLSLGGCYSRIPESVCFSRSSLLLNRDSNPNRSKKEIVFTDLFSRARRVSVPTEAGLELRRVKAMQAMKRMEAKRRLLEKQNKGGYGGGGGGGFQVEKHPVAAAGVETQNTNWAAGSASENNAFCWAMEKLKTNVVPTPNLQIQGNQSSVTGKFLTISQSRITFTAMENGKPVPTNRRLDESSSNPGSSLSTTMAKVEKTANGKRVDASNSSLETEQARNIKKLKVLPDGVEEMNEILKQMPSVTTKGNGLNGRTIEGFLYKYLTGKVCIICLCHGRFLSPAEFVKHAGGDEMENPMKNINVLIRPFN